MSSRIRFKLQNVLSHVSAYLLWIVSVLIVTVFPASMILTPFFGGPVTAFVAGMVVCATPWGAPRHGFALALLVSVVVTFGTWCGFYVLLRELAFTNLAVVWSIGSFLTFWLGYRWALNSMANRHKRVIKRKAATNN